MESLQFDHKKLFENRYDIVVRYHLLKEADFNYREADILLNGRKYKELKRCIAKAASRFLTKGLFDPVRWDYVECKIRKKRWRFKNPYEISTSCFGGNVKRLILSLRYNKPMYWKINDDLRYREGFNKQQYIGSLNINLLDELQQTENWLIKEMERQYLFSKELNVNMKYSRFIGENSHNLLCCVIWAQGEWHTKMIIKIIGKYIDIIDIIRNETADRYTLEQLAKNSWYDNSQISNLAWDKIVSMPKDAPILLIICRGDPYYSRKIESKVRKSIGIKCMHICEHETESVRMIRTMYPLLNYDLFLMKYKAKMARENIDALFRR
jgi:hypothetical protein